MYLNLPLDDDKDSSASVSLSNDTLTSYTEPGFHKVGNEHYLILLWFVKHPKTMKLLIMEVVDNLVV